MANEEELRKARQWCEETRVLLKAAKYSGKGQKDLKSRIDKIFSELKALDKGLEKNKYGIDAEALAGFVQRFLAMTGALNLAARKQDLAEVDRQSLRLSELKKELALALATSKRAKGKAQDKLDERASGNAEINAYVEARDGAIGRVALLRVHEQAEAIEADLDLIESSRIDMARTRADQGAYPAAMDLLAGVEGACQAAELIADRCADYAVQRERVDQRLQLCRRHAHAAACAAELDAADDKVETAAVRADLGTRDYSGAIQALDEAQALSVEALQVAEGCQRYADARPAAVEAIVNAGRHKQAAAVQPEVAAMRDALQRADLLADVATRRYEDALALLDEVHSGAAAARDLADRAQGYEDDREKVEQQVEACAGHAQAAAVAPELKLAQDGLDAAARQADLGVRDFAGALVTLQGAFEAATEALRLAGLAQQAADARKPAQAQLALLAPLASGDEAARQRHAEGAEAMKQADAQFEQRKFEAARDAYGQLGAAAKQARETLEKNRWDAVLDPALQELLDGMRGGDTPERSRMQALWALANEQADKGEHDKALLNVAELRKLATQAAESRAEPGKLVPERVGALDPNDPANVQLAQIRSFLETEMKAAVALGEAFAEQQYKPPAAWKLETDRIAGTLALGREAGAEAIKQALAKAREDLVKHEAAVKKLGEERAAWEPRWDHYEERRKSLVAHPGGKNLKLMARAAPVKFAAQQCRTQALGNDFTGALQRLELQLTAMTELFKFADAAANFKAVRDKRDADLLALPVVQPHAQSTAERLLAQTCLDTATTRADEGEFVTAMAELAKIPGHLEKITWINAAASGYAGFLTGWGAWPPHWEGFAAKYKDHLASELGQMRTALDRAAQAAAANDVLQAHAISSGITDLISKVHGGLMPAVTGYVDRRATFDLEFAKVHAHPGRAGVQGFYDRLCAERDFADLSVGRREFVAAMQALAAIEPEIAQQLPVAVRYQAFDTKKQDTTHKIQLIRDADPEGVAAAELAAARQFLTLADQLQAAASEQASVPKFAEAEQALTDALAQANAGKAIVEKAKTLAGMKPPAGGDASAVQARIDKLPEMKTHVRSQAGDGSFDTLLNGVDAQLLQARTAAGEQPPKLDVATAALDAADRILADAQQKILRKPAYDTQLAAAELAAGTTLPGLNVDPNKCLDDEIQKIKDLITAAKDLAKSPGFDFAGALQKLAEATILAGRATEKHQAHVALTADRQVIKDLITHLEGGGFQPALARERDRLKAIETEIDKQLTALNVAAARRLVADGKALKTPYEKLCTDYTPIVQRRTDVYNEVATHITGKPLVKIEEDEWKRLKPQADKMIDEDHAFAAAGLILTQIEYQVFFAKQEVKFNKEFIDLRTPLADRLGLAKPNSNDGVKALIAEVEAALQRADDFAKRREHEQAKIQLKPLDALLKTIETDTPLYAAYALAIKTAETRLLAAVKHVKVEVAMPLLAAIEVKFKQCLAMAERREYANARTLADTIPGDCDAAVRVADDYTAFQALGAGEGGAPPEAAALIEAANKVEQKVQAVRTDEAGKAIPAAEQLPGKILEALDKVKAARDKIATDPAAAAALIREAAAAAAAAEVHRLQWVQVRQEIAALKELVRVFTEGAHAAKDFVAKPMAAIVLAADDARQQMIGRGAEAASNALVKATADFHAQVLLADQRAAYVKERKTLEPDGGTPVLKTLEADPHRYAAADDIALLRDKLNEAAREGDWPQPDFAKAMAALKAAGAAAAAARLATGMIANVAPPSPDDIAKVLEAADGAKKLDEMVLRLEPKERRKVMQAAFQVRFGCKLEIYKEAVEDLNDDSLGPDVMRLYRNLSKLPPKHALENDTLLLLKEMRGATGQDRPAAGGSSDFAGWFKTLTMRDGPAATSAGKDLGAPYALGDAVPDACKPVDGPPAQHVDWNTLHEAGHAVEAKYDFMRQHAGDPAYGGWTFYGKDLRPVAEKLVTEFEYDLGYTLESLAGVADPALPAPPNGVSYEAWEQRRLRLKAWLANAQSGKSPWESNSTAMALKLKSGEIIHDAYGGEWFGYLASERAKGITGYQFRSPVEWFSEIYAAYFSGKLKPEHPAGVWLKKLETADVGAVA